MQFELYKLNSELLIIGLKKYKKDTRKFLEIYSQQISNDVWKDLIKYDYTLLQIYQNDIICEMILDISDTLLRKNIIFSLIINKTQKIYQIGIKYRLCYLNEVPPNLINYSMCIDAIKLDSSMIEFIPHRLLDYHMCKLAIDDNGYNIEYIPDHFIDNNLCIRVIHSYLPSFPYIPQKFITKKLLLYAIKIGYKVIKSRKLINLLDQEICDYAVKLNIKSLKYIPEQFINFYMINNVNFRLQYHKYIPKSMIEYDKYLVYIFKRFNDALIYYGYLINKNIVIDVCKNNWYALPYINPSLINEHVYFSAFCDVEILNEHHKTFIHNNKIGKEFINKFNNRFITTKSARNIQIFNNYH